MVERQLRRRGIDDERVLEAMGSVPRDEFVPAALRERAYSDSALPIGHGQTVSQPWVVAAICQALGLEGSERVLDVGAGSGYSTAVLASLASEVIGVEIVPELAERAGETLRRLGVANAEVRTGDAGAGTLGAPFDAIAVHAVAPRLPAALARDVRPGGRIVIPLARRGLDMLTLLRKVADGEGDEAQFESTPIAPCRFVPLTGEAGFPA